MSASVNSTRAPGGSHDRVFCLAVLGAVVLTLLFGFLSPRWPLFSLVAPAVSMVIVMFGYRHYCLDTLGMDRHEAGDNIYYLGFLFTVASLISGLIVLGFHLKPGEAGDTPAREAIVSFLPAFGIALVTTLFGMTMRTLLTQRGGDADAYHREMRQRLQDAALELTRQAEAATAQMAQLMTVMRQRAAELPEGLDAYTRSAVAAGKALEEAADGISRAGAVASRRVGDAAEGVVEGADALAAWLEQVRTATDRAAGALRAEVRSFGAALSESARAAELRDRQSQESAEKINTALDRLANLGLRVQVDAGPSLAGLTEAVDRLNETVARQKESAGRRGLLSLWARKAA